MRVKDKVTKEILNTDSVWLAKKWKANPKRYLTEFNEEEPKTETVTEKKKVTKKKKEV